MSSKATPRLHFRRGVAAEHVQGDTYRWVDPVDGRHLGYVVATHVEYDSTIEAQMARARITKQ